MKNDEIKTGEKILKLYGKVLVFVDWANVYGWSNGLGWEVDTKRLFDYLSEYPEIVEKRFYHGTERENNRSVDFIKDVQDVGFKVITKDVKKIPVLLEDSRFKKIIKELFDVLDKIKKVNLEISTKLYNLTVSEDYYNEEKRADKASEKIFELLEKLGEKNIRRKQFEIRKSLKKEFEKQRNRFLPELETEPIEAPKYICDAIDELDSELQKLNINIEALQNNLSMPIMRRKCDFDCEIVMDIMNKLNEFNGIILFSGDGDYRAIIDHVLDKGKNAIIIHPYGKRGKELNELRYRGGKKPYFLPVEKLREYIQKSPPEE